MFPKIANKKYFWWSVGYFTVIISLYGCIFLFLGNNINEKQSSWNILYILGIIFLNIIIHFFIEGLFDYSLFLEKQRYIEKYQKEHKGLVVLSAISTAIVCLPISFTIILFVPYYSILLNFFTFTKENIDSYLSLTISLFGTFLALHWSVVATIYSTKYSKTSKKIQILYFKLTRTKLLSLVTLLYLLLSMIFYLLIQNVKEFEKQSNVVYLNSAILFFIIYSFCLLYCYVKNSIKFINLSNTFFLYSMINIKIRFLIKKVTFILNKKKYQSKRDQIVYDLVLLQNKVQYDLENKEGTETSFLDVSLEFLDLLTEYWKIKNTIFYNADWYPSLERQNSLTEVILTGNNSVLARDILHIERWIFDSNMLIINHLIANKNFTLLIIYYDKIRKGLSLEEKDNLFSFNIPFFYETLNLLRVEIEKCFIKIFEKNNLKENKNDINYYGLVANLNYVLGNIFMNNQKFLFKFKSEEVNKNFPGYQEIEHTKSIEDLCIKYPFINNEDGVKAFIKLFIEKNTEGKIITSEDNFNNDCRHPLIKTELYNILSSIQSIENILQKKLEYFIENKMPHHFFDTFLAFLSVKHEILINIEQYQTIYKEYFIEKYEQEKIQDIVIGLFNYQEELANNLTSIIKYYRDKNYFIQKEFPNLLSNIYELSLSMLIIHFKSNDFKLIDLRREKRNTIKIAFHFMFTIQQIITKEQEKNTFLDWENYSISYFIPFIRFASIIGSGLQKEKNHQKDIYIAFIPIKSDINMINHLRMMSDKLKNDDVLSQFNPIIQSIENTLKTKNSVKTFLRFIQNNLKEK